LRGACPVDGGEEELTVPEPDDARRRSRVLRGPFEDFTAEQIGFENDDGTVLVLVNVLGRESPVEILRDDLGDEGSESAGVGEPRNRLPSSGALSAAAEPEL
jgi:hypothetical protein